MTALLAAISAGLVAILATIAVERMGGLLGGVFASIPTTIVPAAIGFYFAQDGFVSALLAVPYGMLVNALFLYMWRVLPPRISIVNFGYRLTVMIVLSLSVWAFFAFGSIFLQSIYSSLWLSGLIICVQLGLGYWACIHNPPAPKGGKKVGWGTLAMRGVLAGSAIGVSILLSSFGALAGIASVFPAIFLTTMVSVWISQGESVQGGAVGPMMLGSSSVSVFALLAIILFPIFGPFGGSVVSWVLAVLCTSVPSAIWLNRR
ncbi:MAG: hypothetical protein CL916_07675 [Deltaproteobacteria bacterium]|nr:hypothetical protein [Deltaproteobacteria bacterium]